MKVISFSCIFVSVCSRTPVNSSRPNEDKHLKFVCPPGSSLGFAFARKKKLVGKKIRETVLAYRASEKQQTRPSSLRRSQKEHLVVHVAQVCANFVASEPVLAILEADRRLSCSKN